jgi:hypothetical protein
VALPAFAQSCPSGLEAPFVGGDAEVGVELLVSGGGLVKGLGEGVGLCGGVCRLKAEVEVRNNELTVWAVVDRTLSPPRKISSGSVRRGDILASPVLGKEKYGRQPSPPRAEAQWKDSVVSSPQYTPWHLRETW